MARNKSLDDVWDHIFDSLVLDNEPPLEYIKNAIITTKTGLRLKVNANDFAQILERERYLTPDESDILSCRLAINFTKVRKDVDDWAHQIMNFFDDRTDPEPKKQKRKAPVKRSTSKRNTATSKAQDEKKTKTPTKTRKTTTKRTKE